MSYSPERVLRSEASFSSVPPKVQTKVRGLTRKPMATRLCRLIWSQQLSNTARRPLPSPRAGVAVTPKILQSGFLSFTASTILR